MPTRTSGRPLRLGYIADPNSIHTRRWIGWFARAGHEVHLIDPFHVTVDPGLPESVSVVRPELPERAIPLVGLVGRRRILRRALEEAGVELLHAQFVRRYGWQAAISGFHPLVVSPWGSDLLQVPPHAVRTRWWNWYALRSADLVTVSSEGMLQASVRAGARRDRITHVHHGVDTERFAPGAPSPDFLARLGVEDGSTVVCSPRAIRPLYRQETVVDAVASLRAEGRDLTLVMSALGADATYLAALRQRAEAAGIGDRLRVLDGVPHDQLPDLYRSATVVVSIPETDSFPVTVLEAMACGVVTVVSDVPAVTPVYGPLDPATESLIVPVGDSSATATAIRRVLAMPVAERVRIGNRLRDFVVETADYDTHMARMEATYQRLVAGG